MPGAIWKPLADNWASQPRMKAYDFFCLHTMVGSLVGTDGYFRVGNGTGYGGTESHFGVGADGTIYQWQDTAYQADANGDGNWHVISSENADTGAPFPAWTGSNVPAFTPQQIESNARIAVWLNQTHGIPLDIAGSSKPGARGLAVHRYGVPGYMPAGAEQWSTAQGKACPGDRRIAQAPEVSARAKQIRSGSPAIAIQEDDMPLTVADAQLVAKTLMDWALVQRPNKLYSVGGMLIQLDDSLGVTKAAVDGVAKRVSQLEETAGSATSGTIAPLNVDAAAVATALAGNQDFLQALARAVNDDAATRLAS